VVVAALAGCGSQAQVMSDTPDALGDAGFDSPTDAPNDAELAPPPPCTKYVDPSGMLAGNVAYTTFQAGLTSLVAGDTLCVGPGAYHEVLKLTTSGTATAPITIRSYDLVNHAQVDGQYTLPSNPAANATACSEVGQNPSANQGPYPTQACFTYATLVSLVGDHITWLGIDITRSRGRGLIVGNQTATTNNTDIAVEGSDIGPERESGGFFFHLTSSRFHGNHVHDTGNFATYSRQVSTLNWGGGFYMDDSDHIEVSNNVLDHVWGEALGLGIWHGTSNLSVFGNEVYDSFALAVYVQTTQHVVLEKNRIYNTGDPTYYRNGKPSNCVVIDSEVGLTTSDITIRNNFITGCYGLIQLWQFKPASTYANISIYDNTLVNPSAGGSIFHNDMTNLTGLTIVDNLTAGGAVASGFMSATNMTVHHNLWPAAPPANLAGTGDVVTATPGLVDASYHPTAGLFDTTQFELTASSPAVDTGVDMSVATDYFGHARPARNGFDIGADELP
jgi:hypothetical protein